MGWIDSGLALFFIIMCGVYLATHELARTFVYIRVAVLLFFVCFIYAYYSQKPVQVMNHGP